MGGFFSKKNKTENITPCIDRLYEVERKYKSLMRALNKNINNHMFNFINSEIKNKYPDINKHPHTLSQCNQKLTDINGAENYINGVLNFSYPLDNKKQIYTDQQKDFYGFGGSRRSRRHKRKRLTTRIH